MLAPGAWTLSTAGHGGIKLNRKRNALVPADARAKGGWYEEDCEWAIPAYVHQDVMAGMSSSLTREYLSKQLTAWQSADVLLALGLTEAAAEKQAAEDAKQAKRDHAKANGLPFRCSALGGKDDAGSCRVHVLFRYVDESRCAGYYMTKETYSSISLGVDATPDDYRVHGTLEEAPKDFYS